MSTTTTTPLPRIFEGDRKAELDAVLARYPTKQAALLPALWIAQARQHGAHASQVERLRRIFVARLEPVVDKAVDVIKCLLVIHWSGEILPRARGG